MIKNFSIFRQDNKGNDKLPTHTISFKVGDEYINGGVCWTKQGNKGAYLSCKLSEAWVNKEDNTKSRKSYVIVEEELQVDPATGHEVGGEDSPF